KLEQAAYRVLKQLTGLEGVFLEQIQTFSDPARDPAERTLSTAFYALIDIHQYEKQLSTEYRPEWFLLREVPALIFDHGEMLSLAQKKLRYKAALHPTLFELLPAKFTIPQLQNLYEETYNTKFDHRNFSRKVLSTGLLVKLNEKDKTSSKKGAFYYKLNKKKYKANFQAFLKFIPNPDKFLI
ncbi:MAG: DNA mismatch repair protein MutT, partial [Chitinophagales bacterium]